MVSFESYQIHKNHQGATSKDDENGLKKVLSELVSAQNNSVMKML